MCVFMLLYGFLVDPTQHLSGSLFALPLCGRNIIRQACRTGLTERTSHHGGAKARKSSKGRSLTKGTRKEKNSCWFLCLSLPVAPFQWSLLTRTGSCCLLFGVYVKARPFLSGSKKGRLKIPRTWIAQTDSKASLDPKLKPRASTRGR